VPSSSPAPSAGPRDDSPTPFVEGFTTRCAEVSHEVNVDVCPGTSADADPSLGYGTAGIGLFFLELAESPLSILGGDERASALALAEGAGRWLMSAASGLGLDPSTEGDGSASAEASALQESGLLRGMAGVGYFLLRLADASPEGETFLAGALRAGDLVRDRIEPLADDPSAGRIPDAVIGDSYRTGLFEGNAGVAYFLTALYAAQGRRCDAEGAAALLTWLADVSIAPSSQGRAWRPLVEDQADAAGGGGDPFNDNAPRTGFFEGAAGIAWAFEQAAYALDPALFEGLPAGSSPDVASSCAPLHPLFQESADQALDWLLDAELAHSYAGLTWWPRAADPWSPLPAADDPLGKGDILPCRSGRIRSFDVAPGLAEGVAGIGFLLREFGLRNCDACRAEAGNHAFRWLYYQGTDVCGLSSAASEDDDADVAWPPTLTCSIEPCPSPLEPPVMDHARGYAGLLGALAADRAWDQGRDAGHTTYPLGLRPIESVVVDVQECGETDVLP